MSPSGGRRRGAYALAGRAGLGDGQERPSDGGWVGAVRHLLDLHKGYHTPPRAHAWQDRASGEHDGCARGGARSGLRQVEEMPNRLLVVAELPGDSVRLLWSSGLTSDSGH